VTPAVAAVFEEIGARCFDKSELAFFSGGPEVGKEFASLPFDHIIFTGATSIGRHILHAAADNLVPVTLELGGKSPTILGRSADVAKATGRIATGKMLNAGQICLAPDYLFVPQESEAAVVEGFRQAVAEMYPALLANPDYTSVVNDRHHVRLAGYLDDARAKGAKIIEINPAQENFTASNSHKMPLHIVLNATDDMAVMQQEIFGPVLPVMRYGHIDEAIDYVNAHDRPLGLYYFGSDKAEQRRVLDRTISGGVTVNDVLFHVGIDDLPFGGVGPSGMGSYHGIDGFRTFSHAKSVYRQGIMDFSKLGGMKPPYGKTTRSSIARSMKL
jgi:coniferyl-aldehyde dehydrogenase